MITIDDFKRLIRPVKNKIFLLIGRSILKAMDNTGTSQKVQITVLNGETISDIERMQEFGFDSVPVVNTADGVALFMNGNRDQSIVIKLQNKNLRPTDLVEGESAMYSKIDKTNRHRVHCKEDGSTDILVKEKLQMGNGTDEVLSILNDLFVEVDNLADYIKDTITFSNGGGPTGPPSNATLVAPIITAINTAKTKLGNLKV